MKDNIPEILIAGTVVFLLSCFLLVDIYSSNNRQACRLHGIAAGYTASDITVICK